MALFSKNIRIPGKNKFDELTKNEIAEMIDAFFKEEGNDYFDSLALNEFLHARLKNSELLAIQKSLNKNMFVDLGEDYYPDINEPYLLDLMKQLRGNERRKKDEKGDGGI